MEIVQKASNVYPRLENLINNTETKFVAMGVSFDRSSKRLDKSIREALSRGVQFEYVTLDPNANLESISQQFRQTVQELRTEIDASEAVLDKFSQEFGDQFSFYPTKRCPNYRIYISDPDSEAPSGIIIFYGSSTDSPELPAFIVPNFLDSDFNGYFEDALRAVDRETNCKVFVVHGHEEAKRRELQSILKDRFNLEPIVLVDLPNKGMTIIEKFERYAPGCAYAIAIITPDDLVDKEEKTYWQARPNVLLEVGWFMARLGRSRVLLLLQGKSEIPSDLRGIAYLSFKENISEIAFEIKDELDEQNVTRR